MELRQLKYFVQVAQELHFVNAAKKLFISQSALSQQIALLERELNVDLFDKKKRKIARQVELTEIGEMFYKDALKIVQLAEKTIEKVKNSPQKNKIITLGTYRSLSTLRVSETLQFLKNKFKNQEIKLFEFETHEKVQEAVANRMVDIGITILPLEQSGLTYHYLKKSFLCILLPKGHPFELADQLDLAMLDHEKWIEIQSEIHPLYHRINQACKDAGFNRSNQIVQEVHSLELLTHMVSSGEGIAFVPSFLSTARYDNVIKKELKNTIIEFEQCLVFREEGDLARHFTI